ncbi:YbaB/EbfC family nucleoid-associated protein [Stackebrandtia nassauensis]|uniref:YbaB/EbfC DNA-binding family protein n=1 Tax=Stackebrandtia nassauensis (strain DSM 44728 / CIP 108903 / NRRL B-16338 / NBRC 102104 / LLR-40K-21) TaxID=446470 RepID=D3Q8K4_STANL|nr:YbaB/EbfC family nucleoid-associated protein [Stackebrandtia nassauensis]ADD44446.1 hypothetical protein Snas_4805 [Stackebrandtia nassauensis DSM 44728]
METHSDPAEPRSRQDAKLSKARVAASSPKGVVTVVYNGHGDGLSLELKPGAKQRYESETMAGFVTAALRAADRAVDALRQHAVDDRDDDTRPSRAAANMDVARCFGRAT